MSAPTSPPPVCPTCRRPNYRTTQRPVTTVAPRGRKTLPMAEWLTVAEVAALLGVSKMTTYRLIHSGQIVGHQMGRSIRVRRAALDAYVAGARTVTRLVDEL